MKNINKILAVSFIAMLAVPAAQAKIVSETMLTSEAGHYSKDHTVQSEINAKATKATTLSGYGITDAYTKTQTNTELAKKVNIDQTSTNAKKVMSTDKDGKVVAGTITGTNGINVTVSDAGAVTVQGTEYNLPVATITTLGGVKAGGTGITINSTTGVISANTADNSAAGITKVYTVTGLNTDGTMTQKAITSQLSGKQDKLTFDGTPRADSNNPVESSGIKSYVDNAVAAATPGIATADTTGVVKGGGNVAIANDGTMTVDLSGKADKATTLSGYGITDAYTKTETGTQITNAVNALNSTQDGTGNVVVGVSQTNGKVTVTKGSIAEGDVTNLTTDLAAKQTTANMVAIDTDQESTLTKTQKESKTTYPSMSTVTAMVNKNSEDLTDAIGMKVDKQQAEGQENKAMITNASGQVVPGQIATGMIADSAVTTDKINAKAVTAAKIADSTITATQLASNAVTSAKINSKAVTAAKIADSTITATQLASDAVTTAKITDANVTAPKLADGVVASGSSNVTVTRDSTTKAFKVSVTEQDVSGKADKANITGATKTKITYNSQGIVTAGADLAATDVPNNTIVAGTNTTVSRNANNATTNPGAYTVNVATADGNTLGVVKAGTNVSISNGSVSVADATTGAKGVVQLADSTAISSGTAGRVVDAAQLKTVADSVTTTNNNKQDKLGSTNVTVKSGDNGNVVTAVTAENGVVTVAKGMTAIPEPTATNVTGTLVLTATPKDGGGYNYQWEELGR